MKQSIELLNHIYSICELALQKLEPMIQDTEDIPFRQELERQKNGLERIKYLADSFLAAHKVEEKEPSGFKKLNSYLSTKLSTLTNNDPNHVSVLVIQNINEYLKDLKENIHACSSAEKEILEIAHQLESMLEENASKMEIWS